MFNNNKNRIIFLKIILLSLSEISYASESETDNGEILQGAEKTPTAQTVQGGIVGKYGTTIRNRTYAAYHGIPFAEPPIGELRFKYPTLPSHRNGTLSAHKQKDPCPQISPDGHEIGSEDCLYLNIFTPAIESDAIPVMVYIHGGAYNRGSSLINPEPLLDEGILVVSISYRIGVLGFLCLETAEVPGNIGLKDQVAALRWIRDNIKYFGGDPENVTIFGLSAGGSSVNNHQLSPMSSGLFHRIIAMSATSLTPWGIIRDPTAAADKLIRILNVSVDNALEEMRPIPAFDLIKASLQFPADPGGFLEAVSFAPVVEKHFEGVEAFLDEEPSKIIESGNFTDVPVIIGHASKEFLLFAEDETVKDYLNNNVTFVPQRWRAKSDPSEYRKICEMIKQFYFGTQQVSVDDNYMYEHLIDVLSDITFIVPILETARLLAKASASPVFQYRFSYRGNLNNPKVEMKGIQGATHGDDLRYLFISEKDRVNERSSDGYVRESIVKMYANFARNSNPTPVPLELPLTRIWLPVTPSSANYMEINGGLVPSVDPDEERRLFWKNLGDSLGKGQLGI